MQLPDQLLTLLEREARLSRVSVSRIARDAMERGLRVLRRSELESSLRQGYAALALEHRALAREMDAVRADAE